MQLAANLHHDWSLPPRIESPVASQEPIEPSQESLMTGKRVWSRKEVEDYTRKALGNDHAAILTHLAEWSDSQAGRLVQDQSPYLRPVYTYSTAWGDDRKFWAFWPT